MKIYHYCNYHGNFTICFKYEQIMQIKVYVFFNNKRNCGIGRQVVVVPGLKHADPGFDYG